MANQFDRIIKENINALFSFFAHREGIKIEKTEEIKDKLQITLEREADFLKRILHENPDDDFILHFEFQAEDVSIMARRLLLYRAILYHKNNLPVKQYVIYLGEKPSKMPFTIEQEHLSFEYKIINLCTIDYKELLTSDKPEAIIMAILADFKSETPQKVIENVLAKLVSTVENRLLLSKYVIQLQVLSNLRNLQAEIHQNFQKMPIGVHIDLSNDPLFKEAIDKGLQLGLEKGMEKGLQQGMEKGLQQGVEKGMQQGLRQSIMQLLKAQVLAHQQIADILNVPISLVLELQNELDTPKVTKSNKKSK